MADVIRYISVVDGLIENIYRNVGNTCICCIKKEENKIMKIFLGLLIKCGTLSYEQILMVKPLMGKIIDILMELAITLEESEREQFPRLSSGQKEDYLNEAIQTVITNFINMLYEANHIIKSNNSATNSIIVIIIEFFVKDFNSNCSKRYKNKINHSFKIVSNHNLSDVQEKCTDLKIWLNNNNSLSSKENLEDIMKLINIIEISAKYN